MKTALQPLNRILLVPGFMSPAWMLQPLYRWLKSDFPNVKIWDHPTIFDEPKRVADELARQFSGVEQPMGIVTHSFGDWLVRSAIKASQTQSVTRMVSVCPVANSVPIADVLSKVSLAVTPELQLLRDRRKASEAIDFDASISHLVLWATLDAFVSKPNQWPREETEHRRIFGTHNSLLFQPNVWRAIRDHLVKLEQPPMVGQPPS